MKRMHKKVRKKEDGRYIIFYTFTKKPNDKEKTNE